MLIPGFIFVILFNYVPLYGISIAFKDFYPSRGILGSPWVGLEYFRYMVSLPDTWKVVRNTFVIAILKILIGFPIPILVAILLNEIRSVAYKRSIQTLIYLPHFLSWVILGGMLIDILSVNNGLVNNILELFGQERPIFFLGSNDWFRPVLIVTDVWKTFGFGTVVYLAAIVGIDPNLYEAAMVDGANWMQKTRHITFPGMLPIVLLTGILSLGNLMNANFDQVFNLYNTLVYETGDIIDTFVYRISLVDFNYSLGTAVGLFRSVVAFVLIASSQYLAYRYTDYRVF
jgi:putative aldouronate transport system permease protein